MQKKITTIVFVILTSLCLVNCGDGGVTHNTNSGGTRISDGNGSCTVFIIEKDGYKFGVAVGTQKCSIVQIR